MNIFERLSKLRDSHKNLISEYEKILEDRETLSSISEIENLKKDLDLITKQLSELKDQNGKLKDQNRLLNITLKEQVLDEKLNILKLSKEKINLYFKKNGADSENGLKKLEYEMKNRIDDLNSIIGKNISKEKEILFSETEKLKIDILERIKKERELLQREEEKTASQMNEGYSQFEKENLSDETVKKRIKQSRVEMKVGMNWINWIGIVLILIGVGFVVKLSYSYINDYIKGGFIFILGLVFLGGGEFFFRKQKKAFSMGLIGGGIAILFGGIFYSHFFLKIVNEYVALLISLVVIVFAIMLAIRYNSKTIISIGLIGAYFPFIAFAAAFGFSQTQYYYAMTYLFLINLIILIISIRKRWTVPLFISFFLNVPSLIYLVFSCDKPVIGITYSVLTFIMYLAMIMVNPYINKKPLNVSDIILLSINTITSAIIIYIQFMVAGFEGFEGVFALIFAVIYIALGLVTSKLISTETKSVILFYLTALTFAILIIPFQLGIDWLSMGWLTEGALLVIIGYKIKIKYMELAGWIITALFAAVFYYYEIFGRIILNFDVEFFDFKFLVVTLYAIFIYAVYQIDLSRKVFPEFSGKATLTKGLKYFSSINLYIFLIYISLKYFNKLDTIFSGDFIEFYSAMIFAIITLSYGFFLTRIKVINDAVLNVFGNILNIISLFACFYILLFTTPAMTAGGNIFVKIVSLVILIAFNIIVMFAVHDLVMRFIKKTGKTAELIPVIVSLFIIGSITPFIIRQFEFENIGVIITFAYLVIALLCISYGFYKRYLYIRFFGLGLTFVSLAKFFIYDLRFLDTVWKIISYFGFGLLLIAISFIYQTINQKLNKNEKDETDEKSEN